MVKSIDRVYWDACSWTALIQREKIVVDGVLLEDRERLCRPVITLAELGKLEILTSFLSFAEVCGDRKKRYGEDKIAAYFEHDYILPIPVDRQIGEDARRLMLSDLPGLKPADAIHVASAALANAREMHTFDDKLLKLDGKILRRDGISLKIVKPNAPMPPAPLLELAEAK
jgi:predicted nucleic acid-binding protein